MIRDQQFDPDKKYVARRPFQMFGVEYAMGDEVPREKARDEAHFRRLFVARLIRLKTAADQTPERTVDAAQALAQAQADLDAARMRRAASMNGAHVELERVQIPPAFEPDRDPDPAKPITDGDGGQGGTAGGAEKLVTMEVPGGGWAKPQEAPGQPEAPAAAIAPAEAPPPAGEPQAAPAKPKMEILPDLPGGTTTRFIEVGGRGWFTVHWDGTTQKVRGAEAATALFGNLQAQETVQKGVTVSAVDAPDDAGGEDDLEAPFRVSDGVAAALGGAGLRGGQPWFEDGKQPNDLP